MYIGDGKEFVLPSIGSLLLSGNNSSSSAKGRSFLDFDRYATVNYPNQVRYFAHLWDKTEIDINRFFLHLSDNVFATLKKDSIFNLQDVGQFKLIDNSLLFVSFGVLEEIVEKHQELVTSVIEQDVVAPLLVSQESIASQEIVSSASVQHDSIEGDSDKNEEKTFVSRPLHFRKVASVLLVFIAVFSGLFIYNNYSSDFNVPSRFSLEDIGYEQSDLNKAPVVTDYPNDATIVDGKGQVDAELVTSELKEVESSIVMDTLEDAVLEVSEIYTDDEEISISESDVQQAEVKCTYVLGSFGSESNVKELNKKLMKMGVEPFIEKTGALTRVGATISCGNDELISRLRRISPDMWLL